MCRPSLVEASFLLIQFLFSPRIDGSPYPISLPRSHNVQESSGRMNSLHNNPRKQTSIIELLNPVITSPSGALDAQYGPYQLNVFPSPSYAPLPHRQHMEAPFSFHPSLNAPSSLFSLRAASWDQESNENQLTPQWRQDTVLSSCQYGLGPTARLNSHLAYPEHHRQLRAADKPSPNYSMDTSSWLPNSHKRSPTVLYIAVILSPIYSDVQACMFLASSFPILGR